MLDNLLELIKEYNTIIIHRHIRPDGDAIGSQIGLKRFIQDNFKNKKVYSVGEKGPIYLSNIVEVDEIDDSIYKDALVIVTDTSNPDRISDDRWKLGKYIYKIDHHDDSAIFGDYQYVDPTIPACSAIVTLALQSWKGYTLTKEAAYYLYYGITTDTGRFRYRGVNSIIFDCASYLVNTGLDIESIYDSLYIDDAKVLKLQGYVYNHFKTTKNGVVYIHFTKSMMKHFNVSKDDASNLVNSLSSIKGYPIWIAFIDQCKEFNIKDIYNKEAPYKETRVRLRSRHIEINDIASHFRGGGHLNAAGATIYSKKEKNAILRELDTKLALYKKDNPNVN